MTTRPEDLPDLNVRPNPDDPARGFWYAATAGRGVKLDNHRGGAFDRMIIHLREGTGGVRAVLTVFPDGKLTVHTVDRAGVKTRPVLHAIDELLAEGPAGGGG